MDFVKQLLIGVATAIFAYPTVDFLAGDSWMILSVSSDVGAGLGVSTSGTGLDSLERKINVVQYTYFYTLVQVYIIIHNRCT